MSGRTKVRDEGAVADRVRSSLKFLRTSDEMPNWAVGALADKESQQALFAELSSSDDETATSALVALSVQHLCGVQLDPQKLSKVDDAASRFFELMLAGHPSLQSFMYYMVRLGGAGEMDMSKPCLLNESVFLSSLARVQAVVGVVHRATTGGLTAKTAWDRLRRMGDDAIAWGAVVQCNMLPLAMPEQRTDLIYESVEAMLQAGFPESSVAGVLGTQVVSFPECSDALAAVLDFPHEFAALQVLFTVCRLKPSLSGADAVIEWTSDTAWRRILERLQSSPTDVDERLTLVRAVVLNHVVGRDVRMSMRSLVELHPINVHSAASHDADEFVSNEIEELARELGRELVPTRLGWAS